MSAFYNEHDPFAAAWIRELIAEGVVAPGVVDERDIQQIEPEELREYTQVHMFAGIAVWSYALRNAGWRDGWPVWTGSCPCQPFSASGKRQGFDDERHLWPVWFRLIRECRPHVVFGEQVSSPDGLVWFDTVSSDLEAEGNAVGALDTCAAGTGAPHARQRLYFVAESCRERCEGQRLHVCQWGPLSTVPETSGRCEVGELADAAEARRRGREDGGSGRVDENGRARRLQPERNGSAGSVGDPSGARGRRDAGAILGEEGKGARVGGRVGGIPDEPVDAGAACQLGHADQQGRQGRQGQRCDNGAQQPAPERAGGESGGFWGDAEWIPCRDGKHRATKPGLFPLAHGFAGRVGTLRGAGNALVAPQAEAFVSAYLDDLWMRAGE